MSLNAEFGVSKRGRRTLIHINFEYWKHKDNKQGQTLWACTKNRVFKCAARLKTVENVIIGNSNPEHNHSGNLATALARKAIGVMKQHMTETIATPSSQDSVVVKLPEQVQMALPKRASLSRVLRHHRQIQSLAANGAAALPPIPTDMGFNVPDKFQNFYYTTLDLEKMIVCWFLATVSFSVHWVGLIYGLLMALSKWCHVCFSSCIQYILSFPVDYILQAFTAFLAARTVQLTTEWYVS